MRPDPNLRPDSLMQKIRSARQSDASFRRAHRTVQIIMASWAVIVVLDRLIGLVSHSYTGSSLPFALAGGAVLVGIAFLGARGHIQGALMVMQINMAFWSSLPPPVFCTGSTPPSGPPCSTGCPPVC